MLVERRPPVLHLTILGEWPLPLNLAQAFIPGARYSLSVGDTDGFGEGRQGSVMAYCRSCGLQMSEAATVCPACGTPVATTILAAPAADDGALVATFNGATGWLGKTITFAAGRLDLEGYGEIKASDVLAYDARGQLDWARDGMRDWVLRLASPLPSVTTVASSQPVSFVPGPSSVMPDTPRSAVAPKIIARAVSVAAALLLVLSWLQHDHGTHYSYGLGALVTLAVALAVALFAGRAAKRG